MKIILNTDGGARGNPGPAGAGAVVADEKGHIIKKASKSLGIATNNEAEYAAVILGLKMVKENFTVAELKNIEIELCLDSELIARQLTGRYKVKEERLRVYHTEIQKMREESFPGLKIIEIRREQNKLADELANEAMDQVSGF